ncbi:dephospho-CoA kinase [Myxococcota bacterium]
MKLIGLTGGIASGKSTVRAMLRDLGAEVLDADAVYHELIAPRQQGEPSPLARQIEGRFPGVLGRDGVIDRSKLGPRVFADTEERRALEAIAHPAVTHEVERRIQELREAGCGLVVYDVPLLFERGLQERMDGVIVVWTSPEAQMARLVKRGISPREVEQRLTSQLPMDEKRRRATWVIDNDGNLDETREQVERVWGEIATPRW